MNKGRACWLSGAQRAVSRPEPLAAAWLVLLPAALLLGGCAVTRPAAPAARPADPPPELLQPAFLYEVVRQVYRWHLDESDVDRLAGAREFPIWVRMLDEPLDDGDRSLMAEITLPLVGTHVKVKKANYRIEELNIAVTSGSYRVTSVSKVGVPRHPPAAARVVRVSYEEMRAYLFRTRDEAAFPDDALLERLRVALRQQMGLRPEDRTAGRHIAHLAPLSPVANELWAYLESEKLLVRFASDIDLANPSVWNHEALLVRTWDVRTQVVVSLDEAAGSNAFMTRDQIGRALYNCVVLGKRLEVTNPPTADLP